MIRVHRLPLVAPLPTASMKAPKTAHPKVRLTEYFSGVDDDGISEGSLDGSFEGIDEGSKDGPTDGIKDGSKDGAS